MTRRDFTAGAVAATAAGGHADPLGMPIGTQVWPVREALNKDFDGTLRDLAAMGFRTIEMCSPPGYASSGFASLTKLTAAEMKQKIQAAGLRCESSHYNLRELRENLAATIAFAKEMGYTQMVLASFGLRQGATMADWTAAASELNKIGEATLKAGIQFAFHNHNMEFESIDGQLIYDRLMSTFDPKLVKSQFQVAVASMGVDTVKVVREYSGRILSMHLADWSPADKKLVPVGKGSVDWKELFAAAKAGGVKNYFVEVDPPAMKASYDYLHTIK